MQENEPVDRDGGFSGSKWMLSSTTVLERG